MTIAVILVVVNGDERDSAVLETALSVGRHTDAHLRVLHVRNDPADWMVLTPPESAGFSQEIMAYAEREIAERAQRARAEFDSWQRRHDLVLTASPPSHHSVSAEWLECTGAVYRVVAEEGQRADIVILAAQPKTQKERAFDAFEGALMDSGRPVLLVPAWVPAELLARPMIAWKPSREAAHAVSAALPLLKYADKVDVFAADDGEMRSAGAGALVDLLGWHGIAATEAAITPGAKTVGEALLAEANRHSSTLLVLGGYGHSRVREMVFGGVTAHVLDYADIPVLMAH